MYDYGVVYIGGFLETVAWLESLGYRGRTSWEGVGEGAGRLNVRICFKCPACLVC